MCTCAGSYEGIPLSCSGWTVSFLRNTRKEVVVCRSGFWYLFGFGLAFASSLYAVHSAGLVYTHFSLPTAPSHIHYTSQPDNTHGKAKSKSNTV